MATEKNITMKEFNGTDYDILYPKTKLSQIDGFYDTIAKIAPVGSIYWYTSETIPDGFLLCDGSAIGRTDYASLFAVIGTVFGTGDGSTTFNIPDLRAKFIRGSGTNGVYSATFGKTQTGTSISHNFTSYTVPNTGASFCYDYESIDYVESGSQWVSTSVTESQSGHSIGSYAPAFIRPYNIALTPIIKY